MNKIERTLFPVGCGSMILHPEPSCVVMVSHTGSVARVIEG